MKITIRIKEDDVEKVLEKELLVNEDKEKYYEIKRQLMELMEEVNENDVEENAMFDEEVVSPPTELFTVQENNEETNNNDNERIIVEESNEIIKDKARRISVGTQTEDKEEVNEQTRKRKRIDENEEKDVNGNKRKRTPNKMYEVMLEELLAPIGEVNDELEEIEETMNVGESLMKKFYNATCKEKESLKEWYRYGKEFGKELHDRMGRSKKENKFRNEIYEEMGKYDVKEMGKTNINTITIRAQKVYYLFEEVGETRLNNVVTYGFHSIGKMTWKVLSELVQEVKDKLENGVKGNDSNGVKE